MRGRKPKPIHDREVEGGTGGQGTVSHRPLPQKVQVGGLITAEELAEPPADLPEAGKKLWLRDVQRLIDVGIVDRVDIGALEALCTFYARAKQAGRVIKSEGMFTQGSVGQLREHPAVRIERDSWRSFLTLAEQYALTPVARTRLGIADLARRSLAADLEDRIGRPDFRPVQVLDGEVHDADVVG